MEEGPRVNSRGSLIQLIHLHFEKLPLPVQGMLTAGAPLDRVPCEPSHLLWGNVPVRERRGDLAGNATSQQGIAQRQGMPAPDRQAGRQAGWWSWPLSAASQGGGTCPGTSWSSVSSREPKSCPLVCAAGSTVPAPVSLHRGDTPLGTSAVQKSQHYPAGGSTPFPHQSTETGDLRSNCC